MRPDPRGLGGRAVALPVAAIVGGARQSSYFFAAAGNDDTGDGSELAPFQTTDKANSLDLNPGDTLYFNGGDTFDGGLAPPAGVIVAPYGSGSPLFDVATGAGIRITASGVKLRAGLSFVGPGDDEETYGVEVHADPGVSLSGIEVVGIAASDLGYGIQAYAEGNGEIHGLVVENNTCVDSLLDGIAVWSDQGERQVFDPIIYNNTVTGSGRHGIVQGGTVDGVNSYNVTSGNGHTPGEWSPTGNWMYDCLRGVIHHCLSYDNVSGAEIPFDGGGFDIDGGCTDCEVHDCLAYNNEGAGILVYVYPASLTSGCRVYNNICINNGTQVYYAELVIGSTDASSGPAEGLEDLVCYNNTLINTAGGKGVAVVNDGRMEGVIVANNIIHTSGDQVYSLLDKDVTFLGNNYSGGGAVHWDDTAYATVALWRAAHTAQETLASADTSVVANMRLAGTIDTPAVTAFDPDDVPEFRPTVATPGFARGVDLSASGITKPANDFYGSDTGDFWDIGAAFEASREDTPTDLLVNTWGSYNITVDPDYPDHLGGNTAIFFFDNIENDYHISGHDFDEGGTNQAYYYEAFVKRDGRNISLDIQETGGSAGVGRPFDLLNGVPFDVAYEYGGWTHEWVHMTDAGNGWYRIRGVGFAPDTSAVVRSLDVYLLDDVGAYEFAGDAASGVYLSHPVVHALAA